MFYEQFETLCRSNNTTPTAVLNKIGMSKGSLSNWKKGGTPNGEAIVRLSALFNVSADYLLFGKERQNSNTTISINENDFSDALPADERELLENYRKLDSRRQHHIQLLVYDEMDQQDKERRLRSGESFEAVFGPSEEEPRPTRPPAQQRRIPFAASGGDKITKENDKLIQQRLREMEEEFEKLEDD